MGGVGDVHSGELADHRLEFEDVLERALAGLRLVGRVGREKFAAGEEGVHDGRDEVIVGARAQETAARVEGPVAGGERRQMAEEVLLGKGGGEVVRPLQADGLGDRGEQIVDRLDADALQHLRGVRRGVLDVVHRGDRRSVQFVIRTGTARIQNTEPRIESRRSRRSRPRRRPLPLSLSCRRLPCRPPRKTRGTPRTPSWSSGTRAPRGPSA